MMSPFLPLLGVLIGWLLNEVGRSIRSRIEDKRRLAKILSSFLYIRRVIKVNVDLTRLLLAKPDLPSGMREHLERASIQDNGKLDTIDGELRESVLALSEVDPLLAFELRTWIGFRPAAVVSVVADEVVIKIGEAVNGDLANSPKWRNFEQVIRHLAWRHGFKTWWGIRAQLREETIADDTTIDRIVSSLSNYEEQMERSLQMKSFIRKF